MRKSLVLIPRLFIFAMLVLFIASIRHAFADEIAINPADQGAADALVTFWNMLSGFIVAQGWEGKVIGILAILTMLVGFSSPLVHLLKWIADKTENTTDNQIVGYVARFFGFISYLLSKIAMHPKPKETDKP